MQKFTIQATGGEVYGGKRADENAEIGSLHKPQWPLLANVTLASGLGRHLSNQVPPRLYVSGTLDLCSLTSVLKAEPFS